MAGNTTRAYCQTYWIPFPLGQGVCACNSLAVQCLKAADLWDPQANAGRTLEDIAVLSAKRRQMAGSGSRKWGTLSTLSEGMKRD